MGAIYAQEIFGIDSPKIGLMNIGSEDGKGNDLYREAHTLLQESRLKDRYVGNIEGRGLYQGEADVLICEGFVGNVVLKVSEGMADFMFKAVTPAVVGRLDASQRENALNAFKEVGRKYQYSEHGGAPLLGIDGVCIICHGSSDSRSIQNALRVSLQHKERDINSQIVAQLAEATVADVV